MEKSAGGSKKVDTEKYKNGKLMKEEKLTKYNEEKGNNDKHNSKGGHGGHIHKHGGKKKKMAYKKGDKHKKYKVKKVCNLNSK